MAGLEQHQGVLHTIKAWLYKNYLQNVEGEYIARLKTDKALTVEQVCAAATTRGGSDVNYDTMVEAVTAFFQEMMYQLADGFSVSCLNFFSVHPKIGGTFPHADSPVDPTRNKVDFSFRKLAGMREVIEHIVVMIMGLAETEAYVAEVQDVATESVDETLTSGGAIRIQGRRIKITGDDPSVGLYVVNVATGAATKVTGNLIDNSASRIAALLPALAAGTYHIRIITQYSGGTEPRKEPVTLDFETDLVVS
ncbi:MAG: DUF4469 domain-containing protein [Treponematales bacterium]